MKYIVFKYTDSDVLYAVRSDDSQELELIGQRMKDFPGKMQRIGKLETECEVPSWLQYLAVARRPDKTSPVIQMLRCRNADIIFG